MPPEQLGRFDMSFEQLRDELKMPVQPMLPFGPVPVVADADPVSVADDIARGVMAG